MGDVIELNAWRKGQAVSPPEESGNLTQERFDRLAAFLIKRGYLFEEIDGRWVIYHPEKV